MATTRNIILKTIFWLAIVCIIVTFYTLTLGQSSPYEFANDTLRQQFYNIIMQGLPIAILLTLTGTIKGDNGKSKNTIVIAVTILSSVISFFIMTSMIFSVGFLTITNNTLLYKNRTNPTTTIMSQTIGQGALGTDGYRTVKLEPFFIFLNKTTTINTTEIDTADWIFTNKKIDSINEQ